MPLNFFTLFYSVGSDIQVSDFLSWVNSGGAELTWNSSLSGRWELLERCLSFLSALSAPFLMNLILSLSLTWKSISWIHVVQTWMDRLKWVENLLRNSFRKIYTLLSYIGVFKLRPTKDNKAGAVWGSDPISFLEGLCLEEVFLLF